MQERIKEKLEDYLSGQLAPGTDPGFDAELQKNTPDRQMVEEFSAHANLIREAYKVPAELAPAPGFYARVCARIEAEQAPSSFWSIFLEPFGHRLIYASAALLALLGVAFYSADPNTTVQVTETPAQILVDRHPEVHLVGDSDTVGDRGRVLETLTVLDQ